MNGQPYNLSDLRTSRTTAEVLHQHQHALETLRTAFNQLEAKQRLQAGILTELVAEDERHASAIAGLRGQCLIFCRGLAGRLRWMARGD